MTIIDCDLNCEVVGEVEKPGMIAEKSNEITQIFNKAVENYQSAVRSNKPLRWEVPVILKLFIKKMQLDFLAHIWRELFQLNSYLVLRNDACAGDERKRRVPPVNMQIHLCDLQDEEGLHFLLKKLDQHELKFICVKELIVTCPSASYLNSLKAEFQEKLKMAHFFPDTAASLRYERNAQAKFDHEQLTKVTSSYSPTRLFVTPSSRGSNISTARADQSDENNDRSSPDSDPSPPDLVPCFTLSQ
jgi:hypothetical protein